MTLYHWMPFLSAAIALTSAGVVLFHKRLGTAAAWLLSAFLTLSAAMPFAQILINSKSSFSPNSIYLVAFAILLPASACGYLFTCSIGNTSGEGVFRSRRNPILALIPQIPILFALFYYGMDISEERTVPDGTITFGPSGYIASLYLVIIAMITLSNTEQLVRDVEERIRWVIKFLALGLASCYGAIIYIASKALLYPFRDAYLHNDSFYVFTFILPIACILILISVHRSSGLVKMTVSHRFVYGTITFVGVGIYLISSALLVRWLRVRSALGFDAEGVFYIVSIIILAAVLLWTSFRQRVRSWIRQNIFFGEYDYRQYWMEATDKIRSVDGINNSAMALAMLIQRALGAIDISVWLRNGDLERLRIVGALGCIADSPKKEFAGILEGFGSIGDPIPVQEIEKMREGGDLLQFCQHCNAVILAPLCSSKRLVGIIAIGSDGSGLGYNREAREFVRVLANHAASEFHKLELLEGLVAAKEAEAFKSFASFLLHDLKNFASTLSLVSSNAARHKGNPEFQKDAFQSIYETAEKMKRLCNSLRSFSANIAANKQQEDLNEVIRAALDSIHPVGCDRVQLELGDLPLVEVDANEVMRVIQNLLMNSFQAISESGSIVVKSNKYNGMVEIDVMDNGKGMSKGFIEGELFLPFHTTKSDGLGIGLFQCKKIMDAHGGFIRIESEEGKGTVVRLNFPTASKGCSAAENLNRI